ncbi:sodium/potassium-transporting ATPase subunit beta-1-like isoform X2 [Asterias rubens]|uniref:sodium/potassium-transporting ATPase subunit beta-1-like isoform X2 n=1 Tax=Asterias rubens TaxID=7604 RepID=UPI001455AE58|nr:sodium/potassium-transporting ATPase subunit beta-1-like isoform X2 [Asterias rubens]
MGGEENKPSFMDNVRTNWAAFRIFVWNSEKGEVLGRNAKSWGQIGIFYLIFYTCLALFWALMLFIFLQTVSPDKPTFNSYVNVPGVSLRPRFDNKPVVFNPNNNKTFASHTDGLQDIYDSLDPGMMTGDMFDDCANETDGDGKACRFDRNVFGSCQPPYFGWDEGKPCLFLSLNRVSEWEPEDYSDVSSLPEEVQKFYVPGNIAFYCRSYKAKQVEAVNATVYPAAGIPFRFYPFQGSTNKTERDSYVQPYVAVQFALLEVDLKIKVECRTYVGNIAPKGGLYDTDYESIATYEFEMTAMKKDEL